MNFQIRMALLGCVLSPSQSLLSSKKSEMYRRASLAALLACLLVTGALSNGPVPQDQIDALVDIYYSLNGPTWQHNSNWLVGDPCENDWYGVDCCMLDCSETETNVTSLELKHNNVSGFIPDSISKLPLTKLDLYNNVINGTIPDSIASVTTLTYLDLGENRRFCSSPSFS